MGWNNIKIDKADALFSEYIRLLRKKCERCGRRGEMTQKGLPIKGLQASHFHGRRKESVRYDPLNVDCLCIGCHKHFTINRDLYREWKKEKLGERQYDLLQLLAETPVKKDRIMSLLIIKEMMKTLDE